MGLFNPCILDASICDIVAKLSDVQKADVLLHALQYLPIQGCRMVMENAVQSLLQVPDLPSTNIARALLLRAKGRLAAGYCMSARKDLNSALKADPENQEVKATIQEESHHLSTQPQPPSPGIVQREPDGPPRFSEEIWQEIALFLPKRDLRSLLFIPNALSRIASQLLFREIDLHITTAMGPGEVLGYFQPAAGGGTDEDIDAWHNKRSADLLTRILVDSRFARQVKSLSIFAVSYDFEPHLAFKVGMLMNALPMLSNLRKVHCSGDRQLISCVLQVIHPHNPHLQRLSLVVAQRGVEIELPVFKHLTHFSIRSDGGHDSSVQTFLDQRRNTLRCLSIKNPSWRFPAQVVSICNLTRFEFNGSSLEEAFTDILDNGHQLESLMLSGGLQSPCSSLIRANRAALPFLLHFSLTITSTTPDLEFCPAISDFIRERAQLQTYHWFVPEPHASRIGFDASAWAVLPTLSGLRNLSFTFPKDLPPSLAGWLVPRTVRALTLDLWRTDNRDLTLFTSQLSKGLPPLRYIGIIDGRVRPFRNTAERGHPTARVAWVNGTIWTLTRSEGAPLEMEQWPPRRARYHAAEWLESLGCEDAIWIGVDEV